jgi:hypothetical protein
MAIGRNGDGTVYVHQSDGRVVHGAVFKKTKRGGVLIDASKGVG